ncbi:glycosyl transferase family 2 [Idiomarina aquatica]|uniref:Glycosyl transferase family 2 n=2 Tax=Idiomarina aquatica TaxID=1327752 RepID=A0A4R6PPB1_9GAMM|nr:glycosyl transferase family 2 [Idiomarina aquatica]
MQTIFSQSITDDLEWIIVNDGGGKHEVDTVVGALNGEKSNLKTNIIHLEQSVGRASAANIGCEASSGELLVLLDDDDSWHDTFLEEVAAVFRENNSLSIISTHSERVEEELIGGEIFQQRRENAEFNSEKISFLGMCAFNRLALNSVVFKKSVFDDIGGFDESMDLLEDYDFFIRAMLKYDVYVIPKVLSRFHVRVSEKDGSSYANSTTSMQQLHEQTLASYRNKMIRKDLVDGQIGVGHYLALGEMYHEQILARKEFRLGIQSLFGLVNPVVLVKKLLGKLRVERNK